MKNFVWLIIIGFAAYYLYHLGYGTLQSFDEAWYGSVAREVLRSSNPLLMKYNGAVYTAHPPMGYWLMAVTYSVMGVSELSTRLIGAIAGIGSLVLIYLIGKDWFERSVGIISVAMLGSSFWFVIRARSGNLDTLFVFFFLLTIYLGWLFRRRKIGVEWVAASFASLFLTKTLIGVGALPVLVLIIWPRLWPIHKNYWQWLYGLAVIAGMILPWYVYNAWVDENFLYQHFIQVGTRQRGVGELLENNWREVVVFLQIGLGKWTKVIALGLAGVGFFGWRERGKFLTRPMFWLVIWSLTMLLPFATSTKIEIWHLIPSYPPLILLGAVGLTKLTFDWWWLKLDLIVVILAITFLQLKNIVPLTFFNSGHTTAETDMAVKSRKYPGDFLIKHNLIPESVFYADRQVVPIGLSRSSYQDLVKIAETKPDDKIVVIIPDDAEHLQADSFEIKVLEENQEYQMIKIRPEVD